MRGTSEILQRIFPADPEPAALAAALAAGNVPADRVVDGIRRLSVLVEVADTVTQKLTGPIFPINPNYSTVSGRCCYNESILKSLSNGVVTLDEQLVIVKANAHSSVRRDGRAAA